MKTIVTYPASVLRLKAEKVIGIDDNVRMLVEDMTDVMYGDDGVGLAANQVGEPRQVIVYDAGEGFHCLINPVITEIDDEKESEEVREMIANYVKYTDSKEAKVLLEDWEESRSHFIKVMPVDYKRVLAHMARVKDETDVTA